MCLLRSRRRKERRGAEVSLLPYVVPVAPFFSELPSYLHLPPPPTGTCFLEPHSCGVDAVGMGRANDIGRRGACPISEIRCANLNAKLPSRSS